jgi:hypothetical protein
MHAYGSRAHHVDTSLLTDRASFCVEIVQHFHVIRNETDRHEHDVRARLHLAQRVSNIRLEPWLIRRAAPALIH